MLTNNYARIRDIFTFKETKKSEEEPSKVKIELHLNVCVAKEQTKNDLIAK